MDDNKKNRIGPETFLSDWIKISMKFWESTASMWNDFNTTGRINPDSKEDDKTSRLQRSWESTQKTMKAWSQVVSEPETIEALFEGAGIFPEFFLKIVQTGLNRFVHLQQQWLQRAGKAQESTKSYTFENIDEDMIKAWTMLYETELRKFFNIPQLGLTRFYQEKMIRSVDKFNIFQSNLTEFFRLLSLPMEKSFQILQEKLTELANIGHLPEDSKVYYQMWIKILEGHYMTLFQSSEYTNSLNNTLHSMSEFSEAKKELLQDTLLYMLPVPTQKEMDELYKEIYLLKKRIKELEKR
jgi:hypothetical protein